MSMSPGDFFAEAEHKMNELSTGDSDAKYNTSAALFREAAKGYVKANNMKRAGDSYRRIADCMLHISKLQEAIDAASEAGKCFAKSDKTGAECVEAYRMAVNTARDSAKNNSLAVRLLLEAAESFKTLNLSKECLDFHVEAGDMYRKMGRTQDRIRQDCVIGELYVNAKMWTDAAKHYENMFNEWVKEGIEESALDQGLFSALCQLAIPETVLARKTQERCGQNNRLWATSPQTKLIKSLLLSLAQRKYDQIEVIAKKYNDEHEIAPVFMTIMSAVSATFMSRLAK